MAQATSFRFMKPGSVDLRSMAMNLVPFPRLHFINSNLVPLLGKQSQKMPLTLPDVIKGLFEEKNCLTAMCLRDGKYLSAMGMIRGTSATAELGLKDQNKMINNNCDWIPDNFLWHTIEHGASYNALSGILLHNSTSIRDMLLRFHDQFHAMYRRKAFVHWFTGEGMDEYEFEEAIANMDDLRHEYQQYHEEEGNTIHDQMVKAVWDCHKPNPLMEYQITSAELEIPEQLLGMFPLNIKCEVEKRLLARHVFYMQKLPKDIVKHMTDYL